MVSPELQLYLIDRAHKQERSAERFATQWKRVMDSAIVSDSPRLAEYARSRYEFNLAKAQNSHSLWTDSNCDSAAHWQQD